MVEILGLWKNLPFYFIVLITVLCVVYLKSAYEFICYKIALYKVHKKIVAPAGHWFWGHVKVVVPNEEGILTRREWMKDFPKVHRFTVGPIMTILACYFPSIIGKILSQDQPKMYWPAKYLKPWIGDGLLMTHGKKWRRNRKLLTPAFHFDILKNYVQVFNESVEIMEAKFKQSEGVIDVYKPVSLMALDSMLKCIMSYKSDCQVLGESHPYVKAIFDIADTFMGRLFSHPIFSNDFIFSLTTNGKRFYAAVKVTNDQTTSVIENRKKSLKNEELSKNQTNRKKDFLDVLLLAKDAIGQGMSEQEIRDEVDTFLFEGHDTTASGISWILYNLATHPEHQTKCREEVNEILQDRDYVEWEDLSKLNYLTMCIKESMRVHPPVPTVGRSIRKPLKFMTDFGKDQLNTVTNKEVEAKQEFPNGTHFDLNIMLLHHNPHVWKNPEDFDPLRFTTENFSKMPHFSYIPFSAGPRNCIGQNFAMMEMKIALARCLKHFEWFVDESCSKPYMISRFVLKSSTGIQIKFKNLN